MKIICRNVFGPLVALEDDRRLPCRIGVEAEAALLALATELTPTILVVAASLREGLDGETLTVLRRACHPPWPARCARQPHRVHHLVCQHAGNVKRWRDGQMAPRWRAAVLLQRQAVPPCERSPAPTDAPHSSRAPDRRTCRTRRAQ